MRAMLTIYPVRRVSVAGMRRRKSAKMTRGRYGAMGLKLDIARERLNRSRPRR